MSSVSMGRAPRGHIFFSVHWAKMVSGIVAALIPIHPVLSEQFGTQKLGDWPGWHERQELSGAERENMRWLLSLGTGVHSVGQQDRRMKDTEVGVSYSKAGVGLDSIGADNEEFLRAICPWWPPKTF